MINTPNDIENTNNTITPNKEELFETLHKESINFFHTLDFAWLDYETRRKKIDDIFDSIDDTFLQNLQTADWIFLFLSEIIKNSADHSESEMYIHICLTKKDGHRAEILFSLYDKWPGISYEENEIKYFFETGKSPQNRIKKGKKNFWIGLGVIKAVAEQTNIQLTLHNQWSDICINGDGILPKRMDEYTFWYDGVWIFDI